MGVPHSVVPFPLFDVQARLVAGAVAGNVELPEEAVRVEAADADAAAKSRPQDLHHMGSAQWDYCRALAQAGGFYDEDFEERLRTAEALYNDTSARRGRSPPGADDAYRRVNYDVIRPGLARVTLPDGGEEFIEWHPAAEEAAQCSSPPAVASTGRAAS